jgi:hypothetical protein
MITNYSNFQLFPEDSDANDYYGDSDMESGYEEDTLDTHDSGESSVNMSEVCILTSS